MHTQPQSEDVPWQPLESCPWWGWGCNTLPRRLYRTLLHPIPFSGWCLSALYAGQLNHRQERKEGGKESFLKTSPQKLKSTFMDRKPCYILEENMLIFHKLLLSSSSRPGNEQLQKRKRRTREKKTQFDSGSVSLHEKSVLKATCCTGGAVFYLRYWVA